MNKSFTLVELLIVIGILAILTAAIVIVLNPAELLKQARDSKRLQDLTSIDKSLQVSQAIYPDISLGTASTVYISIADTTSTCANLGLPSLPSGWSYNCVTSANLVNSDGTGWIPVNFQDTNLVGAVQLSALPIDPINTTSTGLYYTYAMGGSYQFTALTESEKYAANAANDGGQDPAMYERGTDLTLTPFAHGLVGWWKFDESSGTTAYDSSGYGKNGTMYSSSTPTLLTTASGCKLGRCGLFDGTDDYVDCGTVISSVQNTGYTVSLWARPGSVDTGSSYKMLVGQRVWSASRWYLGFYGDPAVSAVFLYKWVDGIGAQLTAQSGSFDTGSWYNVAISNSGSEARVYVDGVLRGSENYSTGLESGDLSLHIGKILGTNYFESNIDDVRIYNRILSASEIEAIYNSMQ